MYMCIFAYLTTSSFNTINDIYDMQNTPHNTQAPEYESSVTSELVGIHIQFLHN